MTNAYDRNYLEKASVSSVDSLVGILPADTDTDITDERIQQRYKIQICDNLSEKYPEQKQQSMLSSPTKDKVTAVESLVGILTGSETENDSALNDMLESSYPSIKTLFLTMTVPTNLLKWNVENRSEGN